MRPFSQTIAAWTVTAVFVFTGAALAQDEVGNSAPDGAADAPQSVQAEVKVVEVSGRAAQFRTGPDAPWQKLTTESKLGIGSEIRTLPGTTVKLQVGPNNLITLKGVGTLAIGDLRVDEDAKVITAMLAKKYGSLRAQVTQVGDFRNDTSVATPGQVMAVTGTDFAHTGFGSFESVAGNEGNVKVNNQHNVGAGDESNTKTGDPNQNASNKNNVNNTSVPGSSEGNSQDNAGKNGLGGGPAQGVGDSYSSWQQSQQMFNKSVPRDGGGGGGGGGPKL